MAGAGPTANLPATARRSGRAATVWQNAAQLGEVIALEWNVAIAQIPVVLAGKWRMGTKPGGEERAGTFRFQDVHDKWALIVYRFVRARRDGDRSSAGAMPTFSLTTKVDDIGAPDYTQWQIDDCMLFEYSGGGSQEDDLLIREVPFTFDEERPLHAWEYGEDGSPVVYSG